MLEEVGDALFGYSLRWRFVCGLRTLVGRRRTRVRGLHTSVRRPHTTKSVYKKHPLFGHVVLIMYLCMQDRNIRKTLDYVSGAFARV